MRVTLLAVLLLTALAAGESAAQVPGDVAYLDATAGELVRAARVRRNLVDRRIERYRANALERISVGLRAGIAERLLFRRETASRIDWTLDTLLKLECEWQRPGMNVFQRRSPAATGSVRS